MPGAAGDRGKRGDGVDPGAAGAERRHHRPAHARTAPAGAAGDGHAPGRPGSDPARRPVSVVLVLPTIETRKETKTLMKKKNTRKPKRTIDNILEHATGASLSPMLS